MTTAPPPPPEGAPKEPVFVGRYRLVERLAVGGMAEVFLGVRRTDGAPDPKWRPGVDTLVVLKRILPHLAEKPEFVEAFVREARIQAGIRHPNVVQIFELGEANGLPFLAMEYVSGSSLKQLVVGARTLGARIPPDVAVHLVCQAAAGLHAAHELTDITGKPYGLVHRDVTPHNLMVDEAGAVKLLDFGIAKAEEGMDHTRTGLLKGKVSYMAPEQCRQERLDRRADVFALGVVTFELLTQARPFHGSSELATMQAIVEGRRAALRELVPDLPLPLTEAVDRAMHRDPDERWPTALAFAEALRAALPPAPPERVSLFVRTLLGERHDQRRKSVSEALERTLVSLSGLPSAPVPDRGSLGRWTADTSGGARPPAAAPIPIARDAEPPTVPLGPAPEPASSARGAWGLLGLLGLALVVGVPLAAAVGWLAFASFTAPRGAPIAVRLAPVIGAEELLAEHEPLRRYLERRTGRPVTFDVAPSYEGAAHGIVDGTTDYAFLPAGTVRWLAGQQPGLEVLAVKVVDGSASTDGYLLVRRDPGAPQSVAALAGRTLCLADPLSNTGWKMPRAFLEGQGLDLSKDLAVRESGSHEKVLADLLDGRCDAGATYSGNFNTADQRGLATARLRILAITGSAPHDAFVAAADADPATTEALRAALVAFDPKRDIGEERVGSSERITGFVAPEADYLGAEQ